MARAVGAVVATRLGSQGVWSLPALFEKEEE
jgi:hypothetical protein